jgi:hypothetical protein
MEMAWGAKVSTQFKDRLIQLSAMVEAEPSHLMAAMAFETGRTFSPSVRNKWSGATGLIQFMPTTAHALGTSCEELGQMGAVQQLDYVELYFTHLVKRRLHTLEDVYMAILWPAAIGKPNDYQIFVDKSKAYQQNKRLDANHDGRVTKGEAAAKVRRELDEGMKDGNRG